MKIPSKTKFRKSQRGTRKGISKGAINLHFGDYGLRAVEPAWMSAQQIEAMRSTISKHFKKEGKMNIRVFPDKPVTKHPAESRMGSGKGDVEGYVAVIKPGQLIFEMGAVTKEIAAEALRLASHKLAIGTKIVEKV